MFTLITGQPGAGKTSNELWRFLNDKEYKGRPKYCTPIKGFDAAKHGVTEIPHIKDWRELPEGSVIFIDEVQDYLGARSGKEVPEWIREFARHRHYGMDFIATTQSPLFLDPFVRKLCQQHIHYHRPWNMRKSSRRTWESVQNDPESSSAKKLSQASVVAANPKVFELYTSTVLDTHKPRPPWKLIIVAVLAVVFLITGVVVAYMMLSGVSKDAKKDAEIAAKATQAIPVGQPANKPGASAGSSLGAPVLPQEVVWAPEKMQPRIKGMPWSAPMYDALTAPTDFPRIAGCMQFETGPCRCFTQQGTPVQVPADACRVNMREGAFDPWKSSHGQQQTARAVQPETLIDPATSPAAEPVRRGAKLTVVPDSEFPSRPWRSKHAGQSATYVQTGGDFSYGTR